MSRLSIWKENLLQDEFYAKLFSLVFPIMIQSFMLALVSATDAIMLGLVDQTSLSAVSLGGQVQFVFNLFVLGITAGTGIMAAQYWGKKDAATIEKVVPVALRFEVLVGGLFTLAAFLAPEFLMRIFTNDGILIEAGAPYLKAVALSYLLCGISQIYLAVLKNTDRAAASSRISSFAVVLNIILNAILIFGLFGAPRLGIVGAAIATVISRAVELAWSVWELKVNPVVRVRWDKMFGVEKVLHDDFWKYTIPVLGAALVWGIAYTLYSVIMGHMGSDAVAANSITGIAKSLVSCLVRGVSNGAGIMIGNVLGSGDLEKAKLYGARLVKMSAIVGGVTGGFLMLISPIIVHFSPLTPTASGYLQGMLLFCGCNIMAQSMDTTILDGIFCAGGDSRYDMIGNLFAMWCFSVPVGFLAAFVFKAHPILVYSIVNLDEIVKLPAVLMHYKKYIWLKDITR